MLPLESGSNYYEIYINPNLKTTSNNVLTEYDTSLSRKDFRSLLSCIAKSNLDIKHFQKEYKEYIYNGVIVHNYKNTETRIFKNTPLTVIKNNNNLIIGYQRNKLTFLNVPSTTDIFDITYVKKMIFRFNNRIFLNFQSSINEKGDKTYLVYINYNHENNIEQEGIENNLKTLLDIFA